MADTLAAIRALIAPYPGHATVEDRRMSDALVRAFTGESLTGLRERVDPAAPVLKGLDDLIFHCQFGDQPAIKAAEDHRLDAPEVVAAIEACDLDLVTAAARATQVSEASAAAFVDEVAALLYVRTRTITGQAGIAARGR